MANLQVKYSMCDVQTFSCFPHVKTKAHFFFCYESRLGMSTFFDNCLSSSLPQIVLQKYILPTPVSGFCHQGLSLGTGWATHWWLAPHWCRGCFSATQHCKTDENMVLDKSEWYRIPTVIAFWRLWFPQSRFPLVYFIFHHDWSVSNNIDLRCSLP